MTATLTHKHRLKFGEINPDIYNRISYKTRKFMNFMMDGDAYKKQEGAVVEYEKRKMGGVLL